MIKYFILVSFLGILSCNDIKQDSAPFGTLEPTWDKISLRMDFQSIDLYSDSDSIISTTWRLKETYRKQERIYIAPPTKDSIHNIIMDIITKPVFTDQSVTCYAGNIKICLQSQNTELCCSYSSVGNWTTVSGSTRKLYDILVEKTKVSTQ